VPKYAKLPKGDPALGMDALVDVVRGPPRLAFPRGGFYAGRARAGRKIVVHIGGMERRGLESGSSCGAVFFHTSSRAAKVSGLLHRI